MRKTILFLSANPQQTSRLRLDREFNDVDNALRISGYRERFTLQAKWAVTPRNIRRALFDYQPDIIHFAGHGAGSKGLILENDNTGKEQLVTGEALGELFGLFSLFSKRIECVLLNACYSKFQAEAIVQHVDYVIGMNNSIGDKAAIEFATGFYDCLANSNLQTNADSQYEFAFQFGCNALRLANIPEHRTPIFQKKCEIIQEEQKAIHAYQIAKAFKSPLISIDETFEQQQKAIRAYEAAKAVKSEVILFDLAVEQMKVIGAYNAAKPVESKVILFDRAVDIIEQEV
jgi:CHAT domain